MTKKKNSVKKIEQVFLQLIQTKEIEEISVSKICELANINRTTFYNNYIDIYDLVDKTKKSMIEEYASIFDNDPNAGYNKESFTKMFMHIKNNLIFYKTYFKLKYDSINDDIIIRDLDLAYKYYNNKYINYHAIFFKAGISALIKEWIRNNCKETPEEMADIILAEYSNKFD